MFDQTRVDPEQVVGALRGRLLQLAMMHAFKQEPAEVRERCVDLMKELYRAQVRGAVDYVQVFMSYILGTGPDDVSPSLDEVVYRPCPGIGRILDDQW